MHWGGPNTSGVLEPYSTTLPSTLPSVNAGYAYLTLPTENSFYGMWITPFYNGWKTTPSSNYGLVMYPNNGVNYQFDYFVSSDSTDEGRRPALTLTFTPTLELKMPFEGYSWNVGTEIGGLGCQFLHTGHTGNLYFAIDFESRAKDASGNMVYPNPGSANIPILAAGAGTVVLIEYNDLTSFGHSVVIEHDATGIRTRYSHMKKDSIPSEIYVGARVSQGKRLGYMGNTGDSGGLHLDFTVSSEEGDGLWKSTKERPKLAKILMEGKLLKSYQVDKCVGGVSNRYYQSSNTMIP